jgi:hypothetical protein
LPFANRDLSNSERQKFRRCKKFAAGSLFLIPEADGPGIGRTIRSTPLWAVLGGLTVLYLFVLAIAGRRYVWFDELFTFNIARSTSLQQLWYRELHFDCNPPTGYLLSRYSMAIFGSTPLGLRLPSMVEFYFGSLAILFYVRRKAGLAFAAFSVLLLWAAAPTLYYAVEARPYALVFLSFSTLLLFWDDAIHAQRRRWPALLGVALSALTLAIAHVFAVFALQAFFVAEAVRFYRRRTSDYPLWTALALPLAGLGVYLPLVRSCSGIVFPIVASANTLVLFYEGIFGVPAIAAAVFVMLLIPAGNLPDAQRKRFDGEEIALLAALVLSPVLLHLFLMHRQATFYNRYCTAAEVAILVALAILLRVRAGMGRWAAGAGIAVLTLFMLKNQVWHPLRYPAPRNAAVLETIHPGLPIVVAEGQVFIEMNQYEDPRLLSRIYFLHDPADSMRYARTNIFQEFEQPEAMKSAGFPITAPVEPYASFVGQHRQFLLLSATNKWLFAKLRESGATLTYIGDYADAMPYIDTTLYLVTMPS